MTHTPVKTLASDKKDVQKLQRAIIDGLEDVKAQDIQVFDTEHVTALFERVIIASGTSNRQTKALAASVRDAVKSRGMQVMATEGEDNGEWIIVDCGAAVAHIMQPGIREYYHLEEIWGGKSVRMKVGEVNTKLVKASEPERAPRRAAPRADAAPPSGKAGAGKAAVSASRPPVKRAPAKKASAKPAERAAPKTTERRAADKSAAYQRVAGKSPARKAPTGSPPARKAPAKKITAPKARRVT